MKWWLLWALLAGAACDKAAEPKSCKPRLPVELREVPLPPQPPTRLIALPTGEVAAEVRP